MKEKNLSFKKAILALCLMAVCWMPARADVLRGDVNGDSQRNISDVTALISAVLYEDYSSVNIANADMTGDGVVNISDVTMMIGCLLNENWPDEPSQDEDDWVDLGLPSGTLWATRNVGASSPEDYGDYFAWGETTPKDYYDWSTYKWCNGSQNTMTKFCTKSSYGDNGFVDNKTELDPEDDAAYVNWGSSWRMPTLEQFEELYDNCTSEWTTRNGVKGCLVTGPNGNTMFLPAAGSRWYDSLDDGSNGTYWSRTLHSSGPYGTGSLYFSSGYWYWDCVYARSDGLTVRAVRVSQEEHEWVDLGLPSGTLWATCNVGADSPEDYGDYFAWGETEPKVVYNFSSYKWYKEDYRDEYGNLHYGGYTKYTSGNESYNGFVDNKMELDLEDDAAYVNWGASWRMPTMEQFDELCMNCTWEWTTRNGVVCVSLTGPNGNTLFLPAAGYRFDVSLYLAGSDAIYWTRTREPEDRFAYVVAFVYSSGATYRVVGYTVRPVRVSQD